MSYIKCTCIYIYDLLWWPIRAENTPPGVEVHPQQTYILVNLCSFFCITVKSFLFSNLRVLRALCSILIVSYLFDFSHLGFIDTVNVALLHTRFVLLRFRQWSSSHWAEDQFFCDGPLDLSRNKLDLSQDVSKVFNHHTLNV